MRGEDRSSGSLYSYVDLESRVPAMHPLRVVREIVNEVLASLSGEFKRLYSPTGRPWHRLREALYSQRLQQHRQRLWRPFSFVLRLA